MFRKLLALMALSCSLFSENYIFIEEETNEDLCRRIRDGLEEFNAQFFDRKYGSIDVSTFVIHAEDEEAQVIGGLFGYVCSGTDSGAWAHVDFAWVDEKVRLKGIGTQLFERVETLARMKGCNRIQLYTWAYQAVGFYEKLGFDCVGRIPQWIDNHDAVFFTKRL